MLEINEKVPSWGKLNEFNCPATQSFGPGKRRILQWKPYEGPVLSKTWNTLPLAKAYGYPTGKDIEKIKEKLKKKAKRPSRTKDRVQRGERLSYGQNTILYSPMDYLEIVYHYFMDFYEDGEEYSLEVMKEICQLKGPVIGTVVSFIVREGLLQVVRHSKDGETLTGYLPIGLDFKENLTLWYKEQQAKKGEYLNPTLENPEEQREHLRTLYSSKGYLDIIYNYLKEHHQEGHGYSFIRMQELCGIPRNILGILLGFFVQDCLLRKQIDQSGGGTKVIYHPIQQDFPQKLEIWYKTQLQRKEEYLSRLGSRGRRERKLESDS